MGRLGVDHPPVSNLRSGPTQKAGRRKEANKYIFLLVSIQMQESVTLNVFTYSFCKNVFEQPLLEFVNIFSYYYSNWYLVLTNSQRWSSKFKFKQNGFQLY